MIPEPYYWTLVLLGIGCFGLAVVGRRYVDDPEIFALVGAGAWAYLALLGGTVRVVTDSGTVDTSSPPTQFVFLAMALACLIAGVGAWIDRDRHGGNRKA